MQSLKVILSRLGRLIMALIKDLKGSFVGGQVSPTLQNRIDLQKFNTWLKEAKNTKIQPEGGISNRAGTVFIGSAKGATFELTINVNVAATIIINGREYTGLTTKSVKLDVGSEYTYEVSAVGYETKSGNGTLNADETINITLEADSNEYTFTIDNGEQGATITINDVEQSTITAQAGTLIEWSVSKEGYVSQSGSFLLSEDKTEEIILEKIKFKIFYVYYDSDTQNIQIDLFKEVDDYNFKDVVPNYVTRCFVADGSVYQAKDGVFTKLVDGGCSSCSGVFYVKNGVIHSLYSERTNNSHTWSRIGYCHDINTLFALTTTGELYAITTDTTEGSPAVTSTTQFINDNIIDFICSPSACLYYKRYYSDNAYRHYILWHNGNSESQVIYGGGLEDIGVKLVYAGTSDSFGNAALFILNNKVYVSNTADDYGNCASGFYNNTYSRGFYYYIKNGKLYFRQNQQGRRVIDEGTTWTDVSINLTAQGRNMGCISLAICNNFLYFIDQYLNGGTNYILDIPALINAQEHFIEVYTLYHDKSTKDKPVMFAIARDV